MLPAASDAVQVTVVVPTEKLVPEAGEQLGPEVTAVSSLDVTVNVTVLPELLKDVTDMSAGTFTVGDMVSGEVFVTTVVSPPAPMGPVSGGLLGS